MRLLLIAERADFRLLVAKHVDIEWPGTTIVEHRLGDDAVWEPAFAGVAFDAAIIVSAQPTSAEEAFAAELLARPEFAPVIMICLQEAPQPPVSTPRLQRLYGRKLHCGRLGVALANATREHNRALALLRAEPDFERRYRFGSVMIRGHRCLRQIGSGGMCKIYLAESERAGNLVVIKVFSHVPDKSDGHPGFDRFLQEYEIVAGLNHRNIVRIYDLGVADDHAYIAMEHFPGGDLRQRMKTPLSPGTALQFLAQLAGALDAIHTVGVLHRDLKPANVMLRADGSLCLIDFGLAKAGETDVELTGTREIFGTPYYMSPEQGHAELIDARSDLYSLGIIFYEMLTGTKPYTGATAMAVIYKHKRAELPPLEPRHAFYEPLIRRLLAKSPGDRFQTARDVLRAVDELKVSA